MYQSFKKIIPLRLVDQLVYRWQQFRYAYPNLLFRLKHPDLHLPDDYVLYESYLLHYQKFIDDGALTTAEIWAALKPHVPLAPFILDWGCGPARITRHLRKHAQDATIYACDPNIETIIWNQKNIPDIRFEVQEKYPPLPFPDAYFDLVIGFSVLTHIPGQDQRKWLHEIHRILKPNGIAWLTTHGHYFIQRLSKKEKIEIETKGVHNTYYHQPGHRMMSTYHLPEKWEKELEEKFEILEYWDGEKNPTKAGKQDLWILRKKKV